MHMNASHNPPLLLRSDGRMDRLESTAMILGVMPEEEMESQQLEGQIQPRPAAAVLCDGFRRRRSLEQKGRAIRREIASGDPSFAAHAEPLSAVVERLFSDVQKFCGPVQPHDDMTLMVVERKPA